MSESKKKIFGRYQYILMLLMIVSLLLGQTDSFIAKTSVIVIGLIELIIVYSSIGINLRKVSILILIYMFMVIFLLSLLVFTYSWSFFSVIVQQSVLFLAFFMDGKECSEREYINWYKDAIVLLIILFIMDVSYFFKTQHDYFSVPIFGLGFFLLCYVKRKKITLVLLATLMFFVHGRSTSLAFMVMLFICFVFEKKKIKKWMYSALYWIFTLVVVYLPKFYIDFYNSPRALEANLFVRKYTGKNLFSGREFLWNFAFNLIENNKLVGIGGRYYKEFEPIAGVSTHNVFIFLRLEGGLILLFIFLLFFYYLWLRIYLYMDREYYPLCVAYVVGLFIRISFDLTFIANNFGQSVILWIPIVIILNKCKNNKKKGVVYK